MLTSLCDYCIRLVLQNGNTYKKILFNAFAINLLLMIGRKLNFNINDEAMKIKAYLQAM